MSDIHKWYMRLLLAMISGLSCIQLLAGYFSNIFFNAKGFIFMPFYQLHEVSQDVGTANLEYIVSILLLVMFVGPLLLPRIFIWPAVIINLFIFVGSADLLWNNYERSIIFWTNINASYGKYGWIKEQLFFMFWAALFVALLMPAAWRLVKGAR